MSQAERISRIHFLLRSGGKASLADLMAELEVSRATVMRDIELMRDRLFAPIQYDAESNAYRYAEATYGMENWPGKLFELPGMWIAADEAYALLTIMNVAGQVDPGAMTPSLDAVRPLLKQILIGKEYPMKGFHKKIAVELPNLSLGDRAVVANMSKALVEEKAAHLSWRDPDGEVQSATASLQRFVLGANGWEAQFLTSESMDLQRIPLHRFSGCTLTETPATLLAEFSSDPDEDLAALLRSPGQLGIF